MTESEVKEEERAQRKALVYAQKLTKVYAVRRGLLRKPVLVHALSGVSFYVRHNETLGIVGESGSGKTTLGRCLLRLVEPTVGRIVFDGKDVSRCSALELRRLRRRMQIVFQDPFSSLNPHMTLRDLVAEGIEVHRLAKNRTETTERAAAVLERVGLDGSMLRRYPDELSGGQRQRVAIARALAVEPDFLVLDEPTSSLDVSVRAQILNLLQDLQQEKGTAHLLISHDVRSVQHLSHRLGVMLHGALVELGPTHHVLERRLHPYSRMLFAAMPSQQGVKASKPSLPLWDEKEHRATRTSREGCQFFNRCPSAKAGRCDEERPTLRALETGGRHRVACFYPHVE